MQAQIINKIDGPLMLIPIDVERGKTEFGNGAPRSKVMYMILS